MINKKNLKKYKIKIYKSIYYKKPTIFCIKRKKFYKFSNEELLRQKIILFLIFKKKYNLYNIFVEKKIKIKNKKYRIDILVKKNNKPYLIIECKSPQKKITKKNFKQLLNYRKAIKSKFFYLTNEKQNFIFFKNKKKIKKIKKIPKN
ncbi:MAG: type I restriction enzyme HsdR N-terminal domain-containing protein [Candidatus Shikimatogenerans sp. JK-2022]|nr:type I restriction enzyme HsdR N-terminal domain-containing protein [Candidatus Shikimatogenerans bostrichidophilus]